MALGIFHYPWGEHYSYCKCSRKATASPRAVTSLGQRVPELGIEMSQPIPAICGFPSYTRLPFGSLRPCSAFLLQDPVIYSVQSHTHMCTDPLLPQLRNLQHIVPATVESWIALASFDSGTCESVTWMQVNADVFTKHFWGDFSLLNLSHWERTHQDGCFLPCYPVPTWLLVFGHTGISMSS